MQRHTFDGKAVIVTGASSGIGRAVALQLAAEGARLALAARSAERLEAVVQDCRQRGCQAIAVPTDVSDEAQCRALVERARDEYGRLDMLVNYAGMAMVAKLDELADQARNHRNDRSGQDVIGEDPALGLAGEEPNHNVAGEHGAKATPAGRGNEEAAQQAGGASGHRPPRDANARNQNQGQIGPNWTQANGLGPRSLERRGEDERCSVG